MTTSLRCFALQRDTRGCPTFLTPLGFSAVFDGAVHLSPTLNYLFLHLLSPSLVAPRAPTFPAWDFLCLLLRGSAPKPGERQVHRVTPKTQSNNKETLPLVLLTSDHGNRPFHEGEVSISNKILFFWNRRSKRLMD